MRIKEQETRLTLHEHDDDDDYDDDDDDDDEHSCLNLQHYEVSSGMKNIIFILQRKSHHKVFIHGANKIRVRFRFYALNVSHPAQALRVSWRNYSLQPL